MGALVFPSPPLTPGQQFNAPNGVIYTWDGDAWTAGVGFTALWNDYPARNLLSPIQAGRSVALGANTSLHFGDPTVSCPCVEASGNDLTLEVQGQCNIEVAGTVVGTFTAAGLTGPLTNTKRNTALAFSMPINGGAGIVLGAAETFICEWSVPQQAQRPMWLSVYASLAIQNIQGGLQNPTSLTLSLRSGGTAGQVDGALVKAWPPVVVQLPQNAQTVVSEGMGIVVTPTVDATVRYSLTGIAPTATKNTSTIRYVTGGVLGFA